MKNIYEELYLINEDNSESTLEFELSQRIYEEIELFLKTKYKTTLSDSCYFDAETCRVIVEDKKNYFDLILGGNGRGIREKAFKNYLKKRGV